MTTAVTTPKERPVFVATGNRRARGLRYTAVLAVVLACVWLVALVVGMLGFGRLPGASLPLRSSADSAERDSGAHAEAAASPSPAFNVSPTASAISRRAAAISRRAAASPANATVVRRKKQRGQAGSANARRPTAEPAVPAPAQVVQPAPVAQTPTTGWTRRGVTAPPGQTTRVKAEPPGQTRREAAADPTTVPATPVTTPTPPGQQKKAEKPTS
jgi:hypothetical protein